MSSNLTRSTKTKPNKNKDLRKCLRASTPRKRSRGVHLESKSAGIWTPGSRSMGWRTRVFRCATASRCRLTEVADVYIAPMFFEIFRYQPAMTMMRLVLTA